MDESGGPGLVRGRTWTLEGGIGCQGDGLDKCCLRLASQIYAISAVAKLASFTDTLVITLLRLFLPTASLGVGVGLGLWSPGNWLVRLLGLCRRGLGLQWAVLRGFGNTCHDTHERRREASRGDRPNSE